MLESRPLEGRSSWGGSPATATRASQKIFTDGVQLVPDVEGLALAPEGRMGGWLVVSSQGDNAYALYRLPELTPAGRFRISGGELGSTEETDGIALALGRFSRAYPDGLFIAQDGDNAPNAQNFKLASWAEILKAVRAKAQGLLPSRSRK